MSDPLRKPLDHRERSGRALPLSEAISTHVKPGMHLHFASTPSRSNAAIRELARRFRGTCPMFTLSSTGMHSTAHLLGLLGLGRRYIASFFGDNYPVPRPNVLYERLENSGAIIEQWSLASLVAAFRAGARAEPYAITKSLRGTDMAGLLAASGSYWEVPDPAGGVEPLSLVRAMRSDVTFLHAALGDEDGNALFYPPYCEGFHSALGARQGVIVTVERIVEKTELQQYPHLLPLPAQRVLAVCEARGGAHPQPLHVQLEAFRSLAYADDLEHYELWRRLTQDEASFAQFCARVIERNDDAICYREFVESSGTSRRDASWTSAGASRLASHDAEPAQRRSDVPAAVSGHLQAPALDPHASVTQATSGTMIVGTAEAGPLARLREDELPKDGWQALALGTRATILAARAIVRRVKSERFDTVLAGIGQSYTAARLARILLSSFAPVPEFVVETGLSDFDPIGGDAFLLGYRNIVSSRRLSDVDHILGALVCGNAGRCLAVIGAGQVDQFGRVNSSRAGGRILVGSGGANDIASAAEELIVVTRAEPKRFPSAVEFVTSPGERVRSIITERWEIQRELSHEPWHVQQWIVEPGEPVCSPTLPEWCRMGCSEAGVAAPPTVDELEALAAMGQLPSRSTQRAEVGGGLGRCGAMHE